MSFFYRIVERGVDDETKQPYFVLAYWPSKAAALAGERPHLCDHRFGFINWTGVDTDTGKTWGPQDILERVAATHWENWTARAAKGEAAQDESAPVPKAQDDPLGAAAKLAAVVDEKAVDPDQKVVPKL